MSTTNNSLSILSKSGSWIRGNPGRFACMLIVAVSLPLLFALIHGFEGGPCAKADVCTSIGGWQLSWGCMEQIGYFMLVFTVFSFVGFALVRLIKHFLRAHR